MDAGVVSWLAAAVAVSVPLALFVFGRLTLRRDFFFLAVYFQATVYLQIAPTLFSERLAPAAQATYARLQISALFLFLLPFLLCYLGVLGARPLRRLDPPRFRVSPQRVAILGLFSILFAGAFLLVAVRYGILFFWYGNEENTAVLLGLPTAAWAIYRAFVQSALIIICTLLAVLFQPQKRAVRAVATTAFIVIALTWSLWALLNSRSSIVIGAVLLACTTLYMRGDRVLRPLPILAGVLLVGYGFNIVLNVREAGGISEGFNARLLVPRLHPVDPLEPEAVRYDLRWRLNGIELMALMSPEIDRRGPAAGKAWVGAVTVALLQYVSPSSVRHLKESYAASPKAYLMQEYTDLKDVDYASCLLTDLYGNFGSVGFLLAAAVLGMLVAHATNWLLVPPSGRYVLVGIFIMYQLLPFEQEFTTVLLGWVRSLPGVLPFLVLNPLRYARPRASAMSIASEFGRVSVGRGSGGAGARRL